MGLEQRIGQPRGDQRRGYFDFGIVPGDGVNLLWPELIGSIRARYSC
jgi:hypothetical protein